MRRSRLTSTLAGLSLCVAVPQTVSAYTSASANSPLLYGYHKTDYYGLVSPLPAGMCSFQSVTGGEALHIAGTSDMRVPSLGAYSNGKYYAVVREYDWFSGEAFYLDVYDTSDWQLLSEYRLDNVFPQYGMAIDSAGKAIYTISQVDSAPWIVSIDIDTLETTQVAQLPGYLYYIGMSLDSDGNVLTFNGTDMGIYRTDVVSGETVMVSQIEILNTPLGLTADPRSGDIYMVCAAEDWFTHVYRVDVETGTQIDLGPTPNGEYITGLYIPGCDFAAPDAPENISFAYSSPSSSEAVLTLTMPSLTYGGSSLDEVSALIVVDGVEETVKASPAETITVNKVLEGGSHTVQLYAVNAAGRSPERRFTTFTGLDTPAAVGNLTFGIDEAGVATLSWEAPQKSQNGGDFDHDALAYTVIREPNSVVVADHIKTTEFSETLSDAFAYYSYRVIAYVGDNAGGEAQTEQIRWGEIDVPPFTENFDNWESFDRFTVYTSLDDGYGWSGSGGGVLCMPNPATDADYYLFTPKIRLEGGHAYTLSYDTYIYPYDRQIGLMEVELVTAPEPGNAAGVLAEKLVIPTGDGAFYHDFLIPADGEYYISFRDVTAAGGPQIQLDNISMRPCGSPSAPAAAESVKVTAAAQGAPAVTVSGVVPVSTLDGTPLIGIDRIEIRREGSDVSAQLTGIVPGETFEWSDSDVPSGVMTYSVTVYSNSLEGMCSHASAYVGIDTPASVEALKVHQYEPGKARLEWNAPDAEGFNGGYVNMSEVTYTVSRQNDIDGYYAPVIASELKECVFVDDSYELPEGETQHVVLYLVKAVNGMGESSSVSVITTLGTPYEMPLRESVSGGDFSTDGWCVTSSYGKGSWATVTGDNMSVQPNDGDEGMLMFTNSGWTPGSSTICSPRISVSGVNNAGVAFFMWHGNDAEPEDAVMTLKVMIDDNTPVELGSVAYNDGSKGWKRHSFSLDGLGNASDIIIEFDAWAADGSAPILVDNIRVSPVFDNDVELANIFLPASVCVGEKAEASVTVANTGRRDASVNVILYKDGTPVSEQMIESLAAGTSSEVSMDMGIAVSDAYATVMYNAVAVFSADEFEANNNSESAYVLVKGNTMPVVEIGGEVDDNGTVSLSWERPEGVMPVPFTDSFEDYSPYALSDFGPWTTYDADGLTTEFSKFWPDLTNAKASMAWEVWNNEQVEADGFYEGLPQRENFEAHSGNSCLISFTAIELSFFGEWASANDNWLISPEVVGATDVEFWVRSLQTANDETIEVLYSTDSALDASAPDVENFEVLKTVTVPGSDWRKVSVTLPMEARRFAIRQTTQYNGHILMLDDITYVPAEGSVRNINLTGYKVYRNNAEIAAVDTEAFSETLTGDGLYTYYVTTLWDAGESCVSNVFYADIETGVLQIEGESLLTVTTGRGVMTLETAVPAEVRVIGIDGITYFDAVVDGVRSLTLPAGIYMVSSGDNTLKTVVK